MRPASSAGTMAAQGRRSSSPPRKEQRDGRAAGAQPPGDGRAEQAHLFLTDLYSRLSPEEEYNVRHQEDCVMEMPQSGERFRGREDMRAFQDRKSTRLNSSHANI